MDHAQIKKNLKIFTQRLKSTYAPERIILYGSFAQGTHTPYSDIDILVVSEAFHNMPVYDRFKNLHNIGKDLDPDINAFGYTKKELSSKHLSPTIKDALATGIIIA